MDKKWTHLKLKNGDKVQFIPPAPDGEQLGGITQEQRQKITEVTDVKSDIEKMQQLMPEAAPTVGKVLKVLSVNEDGTFVCEWADGASVSPANGNTDYGTIRGNSAYGYTMSNGQINCYERAAANYARDSKSLIVGKGTLDNVLATPSIMPALTAEEQAAAQERLGINKEWVLKGTLTTENKDYGVSVDLTGSTEIAVYGVVVATGNSHLRGNDLSMIAMMAANGTRKYYAEFCDTMFGFAGKIGNYNTSDVDALNQTATLFSQTGGVHIKDITSISFITPSVVTTCNIQIYAR